MAEYTTLTLASGATVTVVSSADPPSIGGGTGPREASAADRLVGTWSEGAKLVAEVGSEIVEALREAFKGVEEVTVKFGANISGKTGVILVEGTVAANLKVTAKWKAPKA